MIEPLLVKVRELEKANRRWKTACAILATAFLAVSVSGGVFIGWHGVHALSAERRALEAAEQARFMEALAREQAERAAAQAQQALQEVEAAKR